MNFGFGNPLSPESYARELVHELKITIWPVSIPEIAKKLGIEYVEEDIGVKGFDGVLDRRGDVPIMVVNSGIPYERRRNFTGGHELGHFRIKGHESHVYSCSAYNVMSYNADDMRREKEANCFAAELLMPLQEVRKFTKSKPFNFTTVDEVANKFKVTSTTAAMRLTEVLDERCAVVFSRHGKVAWSIRSKYFGYNIIPKGRPLNPQTYASDFLDGIPVKDKFQELLPHGWLTNTGIPQDVPLFEHSRYFSDLGMILTLLYIPPNDDEGNSCR